MPSWVPGDPYGNNGKEEARVSHEDHMQSDGYNFYRKQFPPH